MKKRKVVIENGEGTAESENIKVLLYVLLEVLKNEPPFLVAACVTTIILVLVVFSIISVGSVYKGFFLMLKEIFKYAQNILLVLIYVKQKGKHIDDDAFKKIGEIVNENVINIFDWKEERKEKKVTPALRSDKISKKRSKRRDKS